MAQFSSDKSGTTGVYQNSSRKKAYSFNPHHDQGVKLTRAKTKPGACQIKNEPQLKPLECLPQERNSAATITKYIIDNIKSTPGQDIASQIANQAKMWMKYRRKIILVMAYFSPVLPLPKDCNKTHRGRSRYLLQSPNQCPAADRLPTIF